MDTHLLVNERMKGEIIIMITHDFQAADCTWLIVFGLLLT